ncbi:MAG TPA: SDR family oxidoreductase [Cyclobacteriaceae bacterium]|nr:SDR family oxidoreductase [Cyclobacteriaceae bacterium]
MKGKVCVITGSGSGIGLETATALSNMGAKVIIVTRNIEKSRQTIDKIRSITGNDSLEGYGIDLSSQKSIGDGCREILKANPVIDVLVNNAGTWFSKLTFTEENIETVFAVNYLAYFLVTHLLLPSLVKSDDPRIINVSSDSHFQAKMHFNDINLTSKYHGLRSYAQSKLADVLFTYEFERRKPSGKLSVYCVQPGLVKTNIGLKNTVSLHGIAWKIRRMAGVQPADGATTSVFLASSEEAKNQSGKYWDKCKPKKSSKASYNKEDARLLWDLSEKLCDIKNYFKADSQF